MYVCQYVCNARIEHVHPMCPRVRLSNACTCVLHQTMERSLVFLQRAMTIVSMSVMALALAIMILNKQSLSSAANHEIAVNTEGDLAGMHSVRADVPPPPPTPPPSPSHIPMSLCLSNLRVFCGLGR